MKRGSFTEQEERVIIDVHRILGNRWAQIAKHLPGRTDNEVKNFWNSCIKKKLIAQGLDPNTHNLLSSHKINGHSNSTSATKISHQNTSSVFSISTSHSNNDAYVDMKTPFVTLPNCLSPSHRTNSTNHIPTSLYENSTITTTTAAAAAAAGTITALEYPNPNFASSFRNQNTHSLMEFGSRCSMEMATLPSYSLNLSGFGILDENCIWSCNNSTTGLEGFEPTRRDMIMQDQQQEPQQEKAKFEGQQNTNMENLLIGNMSSNFDFDFVESALMPCGLYGNVSPMDDQLAWD